MKRLIFTITITGILSACNVHSNNTISNKPITPEHKTIPLTYAEESTQSTEKKIKEINNSQADSVSKNTEKKAKNRENKNSNMFFSGKSFGIEKDQPWLKKKEHSSYPPAVIYPVK